MSHFLEEYDFLNEQRMPQNQVYFPHICLYALVYMYMKLTKCLIAKTSVL